MKVFSNIKRKLLSIAENKNFINENVSNPLTNYLRTLNLININ